jgi:hypothetical protein
MVFDSGDLASTADPCAPPVVFHWNQIGASFKVAAPPSSFPMGNLGSDHAQQKDLDNESIGKLRGRL